MVLSDSASVGSPAAGEQRLWFQASCGTVPSGREWILGEKLPENQGLSLAHVGHGSSSHDGTAESRDIRDLWLRLIYLP